MSRKRLNVESGRHMAAKMSGMGASIALLCASDYTVDPWYAKALRGLGREPFDVFNHTGDFFIGVMAGMFASYTATGAQKVLSELRGTTETASVKRMNRVSTAAGLVATAAACYAFEKLTGSPDMLDVAYTMGVGAASSALIQVERPPSGGEGENLPPLDVLAPPAQLPEV